MDKKTFFKYFKALPVTTVSSRVSSRSDVVHIENGIVVDKRVHQQYPLQTIKAVAMDFTITNSDANKTFHKSWKKVRDASMEQLVIEQVVHYITTYGMQRIGVYDDSFIYIPAEELDLPEFNDSVTFLYIRGITADEIREKINTFLNSPMAQDSAFISFVMEVIRDFNIVIDFDNVKNKELRCNLYSDLSITPRDPVEFLRLLVFKATGKALLIKNDEVVEAVKGVSFHSELQSYIDLFSVNALSSIFYRFKPLFLAMRKDSLSKAIVNRIRRGAVKHHKPLPEDFLNSITKKIRKGEVFDIHQFRQELGKVNIYRKLKLYQALKFYRNENVSSAVYSIRNGKSFAKDVTPLNPVITDRVRTVLADSIVQSLSHLKGKRVFIDRDLAVPTSGKMFVGDIPFGSSYSSPDELVIGVYWENGEPCYPVDLDFSAISINAKVGWDSLYRNNDLLFSGDITSAPNGAVESFLIKEKAEDGLYILNLNYYNGSGEDEDVPYKMFVADGSEFKQQSYESSKKYTVSIDRMRFFFNSSISGKRKQKMVGVLRIEDGLKTFYAFESVNGNKMTTANTEVSKMFIDYYTNYLKEIVQLRNILKAAQVTFVSNPLEADYNLSIRSGMTKDSFITLLEGEKEA